MGVFDPEIARPRVKSAAMISRSRLLRSPTPADHQDLSAYRSCDLECAGDEPKAGRARLIR